MNGSKKINTEKSFRIISSNTKYTIIIEKYTNTVIVNPSLLLDILLLLFANNKKYIIEITLYEEIVVIQLFSQIVPIINPSKIAIKSIPS
jgi:hypothetical protein